MTIKEHYFDIINKLNKYTFYFGAKALLDPKIVDGFTLKNAEYLSDWEPNATFLFGFTLKDNAPDSSFKELLEIYAQTYPELSEVFLQEENSDLQLYEMIGELK